MSAKNYERIEPVTDGDGFVVDGDYSRWDCEKCGAEVRRYRGQGDVGCDCGAQYNASGQRLRDDWRDNPSNWDDEIGDMEGHEIACLRKEAGEW
jgi:hypothetical protein